MLQIDFFGWLPSALQPFLMLSFLGNNFRSYLSALAIFLLATVAIKLLQNLILVKLQSLAKKSSNQFDDAALTIIRSFHPLVFHLIAFFIASQFLQLHPYVDNFLTGLLIIALVIQAITAGQIAVDLLIGNYLLSHKPQDDTKSAISAIKIIIKIILWTFGFLLILSNLGFEITSLLAGLGVGGIAVALALQNILSDLLSSFSIYFDKPFQVGDFIITGNQMGVVEKIGIKTTRIRALQGEEVVMPNQQLTNTTIQNFKKMQERRIVFSFGVTYETNHSKLKQIPQLIKDIFKSMDKARLDRVHFASFADSAFIYEVVYYVATGDYNTYMDIQQSINLNTVAVFNKHDIQFAYPTQTLYLHQN